MQKAYKSKLIITVKSSVARVIKTSNAKKIIFPINGAEKLNCTLISSHIKY